MTTCQEYSQGAYHLRWEGNLLHMRHVGDATTEDAVWVGDQALAQAKRVGSLYILVDQSCAGATPAE